MGIHCVSDAGEKSLGDISRFLAARHPDEVAAAIAFLAAESASYITGQLIIVDGGNSIQEYKGPPASYY